MRSGTSFTYRVDAKTANCDDSNTTKMPEKVFAVLLQCSMVASASKSSWVTVKAANKICSVSGTISLKPAPSKWAQFISIGVSPLNCTNGHKILFETINNQFANSSFGDGSNSADLAGEQCEYAGTHEQKPRIRKQPTHAIGKGVDRWPMFYLGIVIIGCAPSARDPGCDEFQDGRQDFLELIIDLLNAISRDFLVRYLFQPRQVGRPRPKGAPSETSGLLLELDNSDGQRIDQVLRKSAPLPGISSVRTGKQAKLEEHSLFQQLSNIRIGSPTILISEKPRVSDSAVLNASSRLLSANSNIAIASPTSTQSESTSRVSKTGRLLRAPFSDVFYAASKKSVDGDTTHVTLPDSCTENTVSWSEPTTKRTQTVDIRTGFAVPEAHTNKVSMLSTALVPMSTKQRVLKGNLAETEKLTSFAWIQELLDRWKNPVFNTTETAIPQAGAGGIEGVLHSHGHTCSQVDLDRAFKSIRSTTGRITKQSLMKAEVIAQVDQKFILIVVEIDGARTLAILDQHAADERCRIEDLMRELCEPPKGDSQQPAVNHRCRVQSAELRKPLLLRFPRAETQRLMEQAPRFASWGIIYALPGQTRQDATKQQSVEVTHLPPVIAGRCTQNPQLIIDILRSEIWNDVSVTSPFFMATNHVYGASLPTSKSRQPHAWLERIHSCPRGILDMLNSRACRSAIMFNDELWIEQCTELVRKLADCAFPFQCAHGRPSLVPLVDFATLKERPDDGGKFAETWTRWKAERM